MRDHRGVIHVFLILIGFIIVAVIFGFFTSSYTSSPLIQFPTFGNTKSYSADDSKNSCGLSVSSYEGDSAKISSPLVVAGYARGCGWTAKDKSLGTVVIVDGAGQVVSSAFPLTVVRDQLFLPPYFQTTMYFGKPQTQTGFLLFTNNESGSKEKTLRLPVRF